MWEYVLIMIVITILSALAFIQMLRMDSDLIMLFYSIFGKKASHLKDNVIWIVGSSSGIGAALAIELATNGSKLVLSATRQSLLEDVKRQCLKANPTLTDKDILVLPLDITDTASHQSKLQQVLAHFGRIDNLVNNAGQYQISLFEETQLEVDKANFQLNVFGVINLSRLVVRHWLANNAKGHLAVTSSVYGLMGGPTSSTYVASKHAIHGYFESVRLELWTRDITVSIICPGPVNTKLFEKSLTADLSTKMERTNFDFGVTMMSVDRCAELYAIALANQVHVAWIVAQPVLAILYTAAYIPTVLTNLWPRSLSEKKLRAQVNFKNSL